MSERPHVVALCGSLGDDSATRVALLRTLEAAERAGATTDLLDLRTFDLPTFDPDEEAQGDGPELTERVRAADAVVLGSPMYHGSYSSPLKTALDYCSFDEFEGKTVGLLAVSGGGFPTPTLEHLRSVTRALGAWTVPHQVGIPESYAAVEDGRLADDDLRDRVDELGRTVVEYAGVERYPEVSEAQPAALPCD
jgi:NAD(P)H-dependent FMN reductase